MSMSTPPGYEGAQHRTNDFGQAQPGWPAPPQPPGGQMDAYQVPGPYPVQRIQPRSAALGVIASAFVPGLGSMINNKFGKGLLIMFCFSLAVLSCLFLIGFVLSPAVWIWGMIAANNDVRKWNTAHGIVS